jgi:hypothetical protein
MNHAVDNKNGGFYGAILSSGVPVKDANKVQY